MSSPIDKESQAFSERQRPMHIECAKPEPNAEDILVAIGDLTG